MPRSSVPECTVTMIGATGCGKTTYMLGMYAGLSAGIEDYFLFTDDLDLDLDLSESWDELCDNGAVPKPTGVEVPRSYPFVFRQGNQTLLSFDWEDYRGGAMSQHLSDEMAVDVGPLRERLLRSDSIYLVLNGNYLASATTPANVRQTNKETMARRMTTVVQKTLKEREQTGQRAPSMVVLVTKADLIVQANRGATPGALMDMICDSARRLLPVCFTTGINTLVCPVQLGDFGGDRQEAVDSDKVDPRNLDKPLIFSFLNYLDSYSHGLRGDLAGIEVGIARNAQELQALEGSLLGIFQRGKIGRLREHGLEEKRRRERQTARLAASESQVARLAADLERAIAQRRVAVFEDGDPVG
ncbi:MAG TPA: hypothetical protein VFU65_00520 [Actinocrinis sp.]|nr:hypothetical protein [Actinocrinis sp.]